MNCFFYISDAEDKGFPCPALPNVPNATIEVLEDFGAAEFGLSGALVQIECNSKFRDARYPCQGQKRLQCLNGRWIGEMPICGK